MSHHSTHQEGFHMLIKEALRVLSGGQARANALRSIPHNAGKSYIRVRRDHDVARERVPRQQVRQQIEQMGTNSHSPSGRAGPLGREAQGMPALQAPRTGTPESQPQGSSGCSRDPVPHKIVRGQLPATSPGSWPRNNSTSRTCEVSTGRLFNERRGAGRGVWWRGPPIPQVLQVPAPLPVGDNLQIQGTSASGGGDLQKGEWGFSPPGRTALHPWNHRPVQGCFRGQGPSQLHPGAGGGLPASMI